MGAGVSSEALDKRIRFCLCSNACNAAIGPFSYYSIKSVCVLWKSSNQRQQCLPLSRCLQTRPTIETLTAFSPMPSELQAMFLKNVEEIQQLIDIAFPRPEGALVPRGPTYIQDTSALPVLTHPQPQSQPSPPTRHRHHPNPTQPITPSPPSPNHSSSSPPHPSTTSSTILQIPNQRSHTSIRYSEISSPYTRSKACKKGTSPPTYPPSQKSQQDSQHSASSKDGSAGENSTTTTSQHRPKSPAPSHPSHPSLRP